MAVNFVAMRAGQFVGDGDGDADADADGSCWQELFVVRARPDSAPLAHTAAD